VLYFASRTQRVRLYCTSLSACPANEHPYFNCHTIPQLSHNTKANIKVVVHTAVAILSVSVQRVRVRDRARLNALTSLLSCLRLLKGALSVFVTRGQAKSPQSTRNRPPNRIGLSKGPIVDSTLPLSSCLCSNAYLDTANLCQTRPGDIPAQKQSAIHSRHAPLSSHSLLRRMGGIR
jgi:hypothetical protein